MRRSYVEWPQTPAKQSACSSMAIESRFGGAAPSRIQRFTCAVIPVMFWTWWPTSWAITYACAKSPGARNSTASSRKKLGSRYTVRSSVQ